MFVNHSQQGFVRILRRPAVLALSLGAMVGWSWVALSGTWIGSAGTMGAIAAFCLGGIVVVLVGLTYAELVAAMPQVGGEHVYSMRALGKTASFICTWAILLGYVSVVAFEAVALPTVVDYLFPGFSRGYLWTIAGWDVHLSWVAVGVVAALAMMAINMIGIAVAARVQLVVTLMICLAGLALISVGFVNGDESNLQPHFVDGQRGLIAVLVMVPFMFVGFDVIPQSAEEIDLPFGGIGKLLIGSILLAVCWYVGMIAAVGFGLPPALRAESALPTADAAVQLFGSDSAGKLLVVVGIGGILTSWNAFLIGGSRALYALASAGQIPRWLAVLHPRFKTPHRAILLIGLLSAIAPFFGRPALVWLVDAGGLGIVIAYAFVAISFLVLRRREPLLPRPFLAGGGHRRGLVIGWAALLSSLGMIALYLPGSPAALMWPHEWVIVLIWIALGLMFARGRRA